MSQSTLTPGSKKTTPTTLYQLKTQSGLFLTSQSGSNINAQK